MRKGVLVIYFGNQQNCLGKEQNSFTSSPKLNDYMMEQNDLHEFY